MELFSYTVGSVRAIIVVPPLREKEIGLFLGGGGGGGDKGENINQTERAIIKTKIKRSLTLRSRELCFLVLKVTESLAETRERRLRRRFTYTL